MKNTLRMTHQREVILDELGKCKNHPTADLLYERVKKRLPRISLATVYRNLEILSEAGMIKKLEISGRQKRFDWNLEQHDHFFCVECSRVDNIDIDRDDKLTLSDEQNMGYQIAGCRVEFYGVCPQCQAKNAKKLQSKKKGAKKMACKSKSCKSGQLSDRQREVLEALAKSKTACGSKEIAAATTLEPKQISCQITALKKKGFVDSPARCKYEITKEGKNALA